jgi:hypothetical protein
MTIDMAIRSVFVGKLTCKDLEFDIEVYGGSALDSDLKRY